jgi:hypothetical protein
VLRLCCDGWKDDFPTARHTICAHADARMVFVKGTALLGAIKEIDLVPLFLMDLGGG